MPNSKTFEGNWLEQFGSGAVIEGACCRLRTVKRLVNSAGRRALHLGVQIVDGPEKVSPTRRSRSGVSLPQMLHRPHRRNLMVSRATQAARSRLRCCATLSGSKLFALRLLCMRKGPSHIALEAAAPEEV